MTEPVPMLARHRSLKDASVGAPVMHTVPQATEASHDDTAAARASQPLTLSCVVPCRNEAVNLVQLLPLLERTLAPCAAQWEVLLVDDGSTDATKAVLAPWALKQGFVVIHLSRNFGKEAALTAGLEAAMGRVVMMMDADLQHAPSIIATFVEHWRHGADVVYAVRTHRDDESRFKQWGVRWFYRLVNASGRFEIPVGAGDFRLMDRKVVDAMLALPERNRFMKGLYAWVGFDAVAVPYTPDARHGGQSHFSAWRLLGLSLDGLTSFTTLPLRAVTVIGFAFAALAFCYGAGLTVSYLVYGHSVSGWTTIVVSLMLFVGIQLMSLGVVGEYVARIFEEVKARPLYVVKQMRGQGLARSRSDLASDQAGSDIAAQVRRDGGLSAAKAQRLPSA